MAHTHKKGGGRKDKKSARAKAAGQFKQALSKPKKPSSDQHDLQTFKPGRENDRNAPQNRTRPQKKKS